MKILEDKFCCVFLYQMCVFKQLFKYNLYTLSNDNGFTGITYYVPSLKICLQGTGNESKLWSIFK